MTLVAGIDSSTQSTKIVVVDTNDGAVVRSASAPHPDGTEVDPAAWWDALSAAASGGLLEGVSAIGVGGQQHGMVALDESGDVVRPALLWNDVRSAPQTEALVAELGGPEVWARRTGSVVVPSYTVTKLRWLRDAEPAAAARVASVLLPHDWLTWRLAGAPAGGAFTDRGDASGTGYWSPATGEWLPEIVTLALGHDAALPSLAGPRDLVGKVGALAPGAWLSAGTGDNMAAALGLGVTVGDAIVSVGTSGVTSVVAERPSADPSGAVCGFADATGRFLPLVCTLNAARVLGTIAGLLGVTPEGFDVLALSAPPGAGGLTLLPFLDGERTPSLPYARGLLGGITRANATPATLARAAVEGVLASLAGGLDALRAQGVVIRRAFLVGGGARSAAIQALAPAFLGVPVVLPDATTEWVAVGAARQAAWALGGTTEPPVWARPLPAVAEGEPAEGAVEALAAYATLLADATPHLERQPGTQPVTPPLEAST
jgi:xylulokinase